jgi:hypothetical protein
MSIIFVCNQYSLCVKVQTQVGWSIISVIHLPGENNKVADGLSRCETTGTTVNGPGQSEYNDVPCCLVLTELPARLGPLLATTEWSAITVHEMREAQGTDWYCG